MSSDNFSQTITTYKTTISISSFIISVLWLWSLIMLIQRWSKLPLWAKIICTLSIVGLISSPIALIILYTVDDVN